MHRRQGRLRGLQGVRGPARRPRQGGNPPDIAYVPQPGLLKHAGHDTGKVVEAPEAVAANIDKFWGEDWKAYGTVDGKFYAAPLGANVKSFVWYSPRCSRTTGWAVPTTWDEMMALSDKIAADGDQALVCRHRLR